MNWCQPHWDRLRQAIKDKGLDSFVLKSGEEAAKLFEDQMAGDTSGFDPLLLSWMRLNSAMAESLKRQGRAEEILELKCPMCILVADGQPKTVANWIDGCTSEALKYAIDNGLIKGH